MILPLEKQVVSLELAKRLKELGAPQESWYMWEGIAHDVNESGIIVFKYGLKKARDNGNPLRYAAYTVAELWSFLPQYLNSKGEGCDEELYMGKNDPKDGGLDYTFACYGYLTFNDDNPANACAKLLIHLLEQKLITF